MDVEVNLLQQRFNKIELEKAKKRSFTLRNNKKSKCMGRINIANAMKLIKKFKALFIGSPYKAFKEFNSGWSLFAFYKKKKIYNDDNTLMSRRKVSERNSILNSQLMRFILCVLFKHKKKALASLVKILNNNIEVKVIEKTISRVLHTHDTEWKKPILRLKFDERIKKNGIEFCKYFLYIVNNARYGYTDESRFYTNNPNSER